MEIREMTEKDADAVSAIEAAVFSQPWSRQGFLDALAMDCTLFCVAEEKGCIRGYIGMYFAADEAEITGVAVAEDARGCGVGRMLVAAALALAAARGIRDAVLEVRVSNAAAIRLYEEQGFVRQGIRKGFYDYPREDAFIYKKELLMNNIQTAE